MNLAHAVARRSELRVNGQAYPGFVSYVGNDSNLGTDGLLLHSATVIIGDRVSNPTGLDDRAADTIWLFGQKLELWIELSSGSLALHPRGTLYLISCNYDRQKGELEIECGCLLSLLKVLGSADVVDPDGDEDWPNLPDTKLYLNSLIATSIGSKLGHSMPSIPGKTWGAIQPSGSLVDYLGQLAFTNINSGVLWSDNDTVRFSSINLKNPLPWVTVTLGKNECNYSPIASSLPAIRELVVTGQLKQLKLPEAGQTQEDDGTLENYQQDKEYGPESLIDPNAGEDEILFATVESWERVGPGYKYSEIKRTERVALVFPTAKVNRDSFVPSYRKRNWQYFNQETGRLIYEEEKLEECFGKVYNGWLSKRSNWIVTNPGSLGFDGASISLTTTYADELLTATQLVRSSYIKTTYVYTDNGQVSSKTTVTKEPGSKIATGSNTLTAQAYSTAYLKEEWKQSGKNQSHTITAKYAFEAKYASQVEGLQKSRYDALIASGGDATLSVPTFTRGSDGTVTLGSTNVPQDLVGLKSRLSLITDSKKTTKSLSRAGLETAPATEYLPNIKDKDEADSKDAFEDVSIKTSLKWKATLLALAPRETADVGLVEDLATLKAIAAYLFALRQGQAKSYEILLPLTDDWITGYEPGKRVDVVINGSVVSHVASGITYKSEPNQNLVLLDGLWVGGMPGSPVSLVSGAVQSAAISPGDPVYVPPGLGIPEGNYSTQAYGSGFQLVNSQGSVVTPPSIPPGSQIVNLKASSLKPAFEALDVISGGARVGGSLASVDLLAIKSKHTGGSCSGGSVSSALNSYFDLVPSCRNDTDGLPGGRVLTASNASSSAPVNVVLDEYFTVSYGDIKIYHISDLYGWPDPSAYYLVGTIPATGASGVDLGAVDGEWVSFFAYNPDKEADSALRATYDRSSNTIVLWGWFYPLLGGG